MRYIDQLKKDWRTDAINFLCIFILTVFTFRLFQIQVINQSRYSAEAKLQQNREFIIPAKRGTIYTSDMYPIVYSTKVYTLYIDLIDGADVKKISDEISNLLGLNYKEVDNLVKNAVKDQKKVVRFPQNFDYSFAKRIDNSEIKKFVHFEESYSRFYPEESMLSHVLGFVGKDKNNDDTGYFGIEQRYNGDLSGKNGKYSHESSASGGQIVWGADDSVPPVDGSDLVLTINRNIQYMVEKKLEEGVKKYNAKSGTVIIVNPSTGSIISLANFPDYIPSRYFDDKYTSDVFRNSSISAIYEPGSVIKAITMASALDAGKVNYDSTYLDNSAKYFSGYLVDNWDKKHHGLETMTSILQHSNNLGAAWVGMQLGDSQLISYMEAFGYGTQLGIDIDGEERGIIYKKTPLKDIEIANASFGQGISLTPLQVVMSFSAIANNGFLMKPYLIEKIILPNKEITTRSTIASRPISQETADKMVKMLTDAASGGEAKYFVSKKYKVAGKTGTAQVPIRGGYDPTRTNATFVGFFPSYKNFVMLVKLEEPTFPSGYSSETAVPLWMSIAEDLALYYDLIQDK